MFTVKRSQATLFRGQIGEQSQPIAAGCDYIESCATRLYGKLALGQQELLVVDGSRGQLSIELARRGAIVVGLDESPAALRQAQRLAQGHALGQVITYVQGSIEALPFATGSFSMAVWWQAQGQVKDWRTAIAEVARVLAPGGLLVFSFLNRTWLSRLLLSPVGEHLPLDLKAGGSLRPQALIRPRELAFLLTAYGLQPSEIRGFLPRGLASGGLVWDLSRFRGLFYLGYAVRLPPRGSLARHASLLGHGDDISAR
ncbi:class I SAM-dependent methyltransferase [Thermogemmatispora sp.]|uniref:class I SAM-dependent methyltransferase n=1 Tax=Thermogemmatispora sp. TaxID=1968838 RepID=UPI001DD0A660|nr:methyltransferase domain-containing protein [Thermogemmatispora sp.]MBX5451237.1 methyltransferase domain-containing protein [Thermogemmatispora sp.]